jgi:excisionase family DNA binding protein
MSATAHATESRDSEYISAREVMRKFGLSRTTVYRLLKNGKIRSVRLSPHAIRIHRDDLQAWLDRSVQQPQEQKPNKKPPSRRKTAKKAR